MATTSALAQSRGTRTPLWATALALALMLAGRGRSEHSRSASTRASQSEHERDQCSRSKPSSSRTSSEDDRGRAAESPAEIPARGWKDIALRVYHGISEDRIVAISAGATFFVLLALFPAIAGLIALYGLFADPASINQHLATLAGVVPEGGMEVIREQVERLAAQPAQHLGIATFVSLVISLWSANGGMKALFDALNVVYHEREKRGFIKLNSISLTFTLGAVVFMLTALATLTVLPAMLEYVGLSRTSELLIKIGRFPLLLLVISFAIAFIYRFGPSRDKPQWRWITPGSAFAAFGWLTASMLFSWYAANLGSYNKTYGSLGAIIGFMTWLWISTIVILVGAKLNAEIEHQTARDTTEGAPKPLGARGAHMADTVGKGIDASESSARDRAREQ